MLYFSSESVFSEILLIGLRNPLKSTEQEGRVNMATKALLMQLVLI